MCENDIKNLVFIVTDSIRAKNLTCYGYLKPTSPNISNLAKEGVLFENAYSCTVGSDSSFTTIFSGKYPRSHGIIGHGSRIKKEDLGKFPETLLLPEILRARGYTTVAISPLGWGGRPIAKWHRRGYALYHDRIMKLSEPWIFTPRTIRRGIGYLLSASGSDRKFGMGRFDAKTVTDVAIKIVRKYGNKKLFLHIDYDEAHPPYDPPLIYIKKFYDENGSTVNDRILEETINRIGDKKWLSGLKSWLREAPSTEYVIAQYDAEIAFVDHEIGRLLDVLEDEGLWDTTFIILTSDHGESLTEHGIHFDSHGLYDETIHVPLIFKFPGSLKNKRIEGFVQHVDVLPTLMDVLGIEKHKTDGESLIPLMYGEAETLRSAIYAEEACTEWKRAIRTEKYKYIHAPSKRGAICRYCNCIHGGTRELYDLSIDPGETQNLVEEKPEVAEKLRRNLSAWIQSFEKTPTIRLYKMDQ